LKQHEQKAFWKFFLTYFGSVALLILAAGYLYFHEQEQQMLKAENFELIDYARQFKMLRGNYSDPDITHEIVSVRIENFSMDNLNLDDGYFSKFVPHDWNGSYLFIQKNSRSFEQEIDALRLKVIGFQFFLLSIFALISFILARHALRPMQETILKLDSFAKDLIHDLNTPVTSILLNMKLLQKEKEYETNRALQRIKKNVQEISQLHENLTILLQEGTFQLEKRDICQIISEVVSTHKALFPHLKFALACRPTSVVVNANALHQVITSLVSNAGKYNKPDGSITIKMEGKILHIQDSGIGIVHPGKVFERNFSEHSRSSGLGLDIVKRLCDAMEIEISVESELGLGTTFTLTLR